MGQAILLAAIYLKFDPQMQQSQGIPFVSYKAGI